MKTVLVVAALALFAQTAAIAADASCDAQATEKKLNGAAKTSFLKKCNSDATAMVKKSCTDQASDKKLNGAAKNSFVNKCVKDGMAMKAQ